MNLTRRESLKVGAGALVGATALRDLLAAAGASDRIRISARMESFGGEFESAKKAGLDGVEFGVGQAADKLAIADADRRAAIKDVLRSLGLAVSSLSMDLLIENPLATDGRAPAWVEQTIEACSDFGARRVVLPVFGKADLFLEDGRDDPDVNALVDRLKILAPTAKDAGVVLGLLFMLPARKFHELLDRVGSECVGVCYNIGSATSAGLDVAGDIRSLKDRLALIHFNNGKDYLGRGDVKMEPVAAALRAIRYNGWIVLATSCPTKDGAADCRKNTAYVRKLLGL